MKNSMKAQCNESSAPCRILEQNKKQSKTFCFVCLAGLLYCFLPLSLRILEGDRHRSREGEMVHFASMFSVPNSEYQ